MNQSYATVLSAEERERLILQHLPQVRWIAGSLHERLPASILEEDLVSAGIVGLIAAIDNFDPTRANSLRTYAEHRIRGAILDSIRGLDGIPSHQRKRAKEVQTAMAAAERKLSRTPTEEEIAEQMGLTLDEYRKTLFDVRGVSLGALETNSEDGGRPDLLSCLADREELTPSWIVEHDALQRLLVEGIECMPEIERTVISLYYLEELRLVEIARVLDLHTSRISQLKSQAILRLRSFMQKRWPGRV